LGFGVKKCVRRRKGGTITPAYYFRAGLFHSVRSSGLLNNRGPKAKAEETAFKSRSELPVENGPCDRHLQADQIVIYFMPSALPQEAGKPPLGSELKGKTRNDDPQ